MQVKAVASLSSFLGEMAQFARSAVKKLLDNPVSLALPSTMIISTAFFFASLFGEECGRGQVKQSSGTYICQNKLEFRILQRRGSAYQIAIICKNAEHSRTAWTCGKDETGTSDINKLGVIAAQLCGIKYTKSKKFFAAIGTGSISAPAYHDLTAKIGLVLQKLADLSKAAAAMRLRIFMNASKFIADIVDIAMCGDGTWLTRGRKSRFGIATVLAAETGDVIDTVVVSSYCTICCRFLLPESVNHICQINHRKSAGAMEVTGMLEAFMRSIKKFGFRSVIIHKSKTGLCWN
jgi:hypothetical protein